jgi:hypothetical protein
MRACCRARRCDHNDSEDEGSFAATIGGIGMTLTLMMIGLCSNNGERRISSDNDKIGSKKRWTFRYVIIEIDIVAVDDVA